MEHLPVVSTASIKQPTNQIQLSWPPAMKMARIPSFSCLDLPKTPVPLELKLLLNWPKMVTLWRLADFVGQWQRSSLFSIISAESEDCFLFVYLYGHAYDRYYHIFTSAAIGIVLAPQTPTLPPSMTKSVCICQSSQTIKQWWKWLKFYIHNVWYLYIHNKSSEKK